MKHNLNAENQLWFLSCSKEASSHKNLHTKNFLYNTSHENLKDERELKTYTTLEVVLELLNKFHDMIL